MRHPDIRNAINVYDPNMDESKRQAHCKLGCLVCGNNSWIHDLMLRLATGRGKIEPWRPPYSHIQVHTEDGKRAAHGILLKGWRELLPWHFAGMQKLHSPGEVAKVRPPSGET